MNIGDTRLLQLADHLETGKLGHERFDFSQYNDLSAPVCGTAGCALGECPTLWPEHWIWTSGGIPAIPGLGTHEKSAYRWFEINFDEYEHLFFPFSQNCSKYGGKELDDDATKEEVAANIRDFVALRNPLP